MNNDGLRAHGMTVDVSEEDLAEIDLAIQQARLKVGPLRYCPPPKHTPHSCHEDEPEMFPCEFDAVIHAMPNAVFIIEPITYRAIEFLVKKFVHRQTNEGCFKFIGKQDLGQVSDGDLHYVVYKNGQRFYGDSL
jgi:hypothetical protein